ncbi:hydrogenase nickel incorporation protein HypB [uncultured Rubinisphaera sp.]|uniref:hydrogenase nickel incorporation protein HypB n=1 Tax=uncultured Rubinisphaera sp. TaxID=1678686 RepID=UPI0030D9C9F1|tara:strand:- start:69 stop:728 length:660 start_codon:yes stop_codon:yes gene_type:complete
MNQTITVNRDLKADLKEQANRFRQRMSDRATLVVNLVSSPGAGKTSLLQRTATKIGDEYRLAVLVGDLATDRDAERLKPYVPVQQLTTGGACHLEIPLIESGYELLDQSDLDILFIENVGNLVCPASHDLGEHLRVTLLSVTEGDDKPGKYPKMFRTSQAMVITKTDLLPYVPFEVASAIEDARRIQPELDFLTTSSQTLAGVDEWCEFLVRQLRKIQK